MKAEFPIVERGEGPPLVLVPGVQGRWEYSRATVDALAASHRVITFSLRDGRADRAGGESIVDTLARQVERAMDRVQVPRAAIVGVSFGGLVALRFAATRRSRTTALVMVSAPGPQWHLRPRHDFYARAPWLFGPAFLAEAPWRLRREIAAALPDAGARRAFTRRQLRTVLTSPLSLSRMAARARAIGGYDRVADCARVGTPTLIVHGDPALDHVTGDGGTELYAGLIPNARSALLERTGHLGSVTRAEVCARLIHEFLVDAKKDAHHSAA